MVNKTKKDKIIKFLAIVFREKNRDNTNTILKNLKAP